VFKNFFLIAISALVSLGVVEIGLRLFDPLNFEPHISRKQANVPLVNSENFFCVGGPNRRSPHDIVYSRETPNQSYFEFRNATVTFIEINEHGFRGDFSSDDDKRLSFWATRSPAERLRMRPKPFQPFCPCGLAIPIL